MTDRLRQIWKAAFGDPDEYLDLFFTTAYSPQRCLCTGDAMAYWFDCGLEGRKLAYVYAVAVDPALQGRGLGTGLMERLHEVLRLRGYDGAMLVPSGEGLFRFYERLGYRTVGYIREFTARAGTAVPVEKLSTQSYAALRRQYPVVIQEGENLALLEKLAEFYAGPGFLAALDRRSKCCLELLGDPAAAPGLTAAVGLEECRFRTPGHDRPFAMAKALTDAPLPCPVHFGFAFD